MSVPTPTPSNAARPPIRSRVAVAMGRAVALASRVTHLGTGSVIGGRAALAVDPDLLAHLTAHRDVILVSATNGKTTTTSLTTAAVGADRPIVSNWRGANMTPGIVAALGPSRPSETAVLEVDERWLEKVLPATRPAVVALLNLSRDQLDRTQEVRKVAARWRSALERTATTVVANADDPLVTWAALGAERTVWVASGQDWTADASGCPQCSSRIEFASGSWRCTGCDLARPQPDVVIDDTGITLPSGHLVVTPALPGRANRVNAGFALAIAWVLGVDLERAAIALTEVREVAGRYRRAEVDGTAVRQLLAKNPAGWHEALEMLASNTAPAIVAINARIADGLDPSWLWDVDFEALRGRTVVAIGDRRLDLAVRLGYADIEHVVADDLRAAVAIARRSRGWSSDVPVDVVANYTAFRDHLSETGGVV